MGEGSGGWGREGGRGVKVVAGGSPMDPLSLHAGWMDAVQAIGR